MIVIGFIAAIVVPVFMVLWGVRLRKNPPAYLQGRLSFARKGRSVMRICGIMQIRFFLI